jgi:enterochelin esterase-like enzyme
MIVKTGLTVMMFLITILSSAQYQSQSGFYEAGTVNEGLSMESSILKGNVKYTVYLPPNYDKSTQKYPVLYLLHGHGDSEITWVQRGEIQKTLDRARLNAKNAGTNSNSTKT